jgi:threonine/homoserine/homoserine lactone efflux protein
VLPGGVLPGEKVVELSSFDPVSRQGYTLMAHAFAVTVLNPKGMIFHVAFLPRFLETGQPILPQLLILAVTFLVMAAMNSTFYACLAGHVRGYLRDPSHLRLLHRLGGTLLILTGGSILLSGK